MAEYGRPNVPRQVPREAGGLSPAGPPIPASRGGVFVFADTAGRLAAVPYTVGQSGYQSNTGTAWVATATTAGSWVQPAPAAHVHAAADVTSGTFADARLPFEYDRTDGHLRVGMPGSGVRVGNYAGDSTYPAVWMGANSVGPDFTNYSLLWDPTNGTIFNSPVGAMGFRILNSTMMVANANGVTINNSVYGAGSGVGLVVASGKVGISTASPGSLLSFGTSVADRIIDLYDDSTTRIGFGMQSGCLRVNLHAGNRLGIFDSHSGGTEAVSLAANGEVKTNNRFFVDSSSVISNNITGAQVYVRNTLAFGGAHAGVTVDKGAYAAVGTMGFCTAGTSEWDLGSYTDIFWLRDAGFNQVVTVQQGCPPGSLTISNTGQVAIAGPFKLKSYTVATLPTPGTGGRLAWASNGRSGSQGAGAGTGVTVQDNGTNWQRIEDGTTVAA
jgi:hypothetical protein